MISYHFLSNVVDYNVCLVGGTTVSSKFLQGEGQSTEIILGEVEYAAIVGQE